MVVCFKSELGDLYYAHSFLYLVLLSSYIQTLVRGGAKEKHIRALKGNSYGLAVVIVLDIYSVGHICGKNTHPVNRRKIYLAGYSLISRITILGL